jgi:valyl-tRNA synthetase
MYSRLTGHYPFSDVLIHGLILDSQNRKMSKSLGNVVDPLDVIGGISIREMVERLKSSNLPVEEIGWL